MSDADLVARRFRRGRLLEAIHGTASPSGLPALAIGVLLAVLVGGVATGPELIDQLEHLRVSGRPQPPSAPDR